jgi:hypothetical protein
VKAPLLDAAIVNRRRRLALPVDGVADFRVGHAFDLNPIGALRRHSERIRNGK